jgi:hypothetical protein
VRDRRAEVDERGDAEIARVDAGERAAVELRELVQEARELREARDLLERQEDARDVAELALGGHVRDAPRHERRAVTGRRVPGHLRQPRRRHVAELVDALAVVLRARGRDAIAERAVEEDVALLRLPLDRDARGERLPVEVVVRALRGDADDAPFDRAPREPHPEREREAAERAEDVLRDLAVRRVLEERRERVAREVGDEAAGVVDRGDERVEVVAERARERLRAGAPMLHQLLRELGEAGDVDHEHRPREAALGVAESVLLDDEVGDERVHFLAPQQRIPLGIGLGSASAGRRAWSLLPAGTDEYGDLRSIVRSVCKGRFWRWIRR